jgi:integrase
MASISERTWINKTGKEQKAYVVYYTDGRGKRFSKQFTRRKDAVAFRGEKEVAQTQGKSSASSNATVVAAAEAWLSIAESEGVRDVGIPVTEQTLRMYRSHVENYIKPYFGNMKLRLLQTHNVHEFVSYLLKKAPSNATAKSVLISFKSMLKVAKSRHLFEGLDLKDVKIAVRREKEKKNVVVPTEKEVQCILSAADALARGDAVLPKRKLDKGQVRRMTQAWVRWHPLVYMLFETGMRMGEIRGLPWRCINFQEGYLFVEQAATEKGAIKPPKTEYGYRRLALSGRLLGMLKVLQAQQGEGRKLVFGTSSDKPEGLGNIANRCWKPLLEAAKSQSINRHAMRHFRASLLTKAKWNVKELQVELGHHCPGFTLKQYVHLFADDNTERGRRSVEASESLFDGVEQVDKEIS